MLRPIKTGKHASNSQQRLWFSDNDHDLFIWTEDDLPFAFQFSYNKSKDKHSLNWHKENGYRHDRIDNGGQNISNYKMTPIMAPDGMINPDYIASLFKTISQNIEPELARFISHKIDNSTLNY